VSKDKL